jgi:hypothetical protein
VFHEDPLMRRVTEIIDRVVEAGLHIFWNSLRMNLKKYIPGRYLSFIHLMDITALTCITYNLPSISFSSPFDGLVPKCSLLYGQGVVQSCIKQKK